MATAIVVEVLPAAYRDCLWADRALTTEHGYTTRFGDGAKPVRVELPARPE